MTTQEGEVKPTVGCTAPKAPSSEKTRQRGPGAGGGVRRPPEFDHKAWVELAWQAIERSLARCPVKIDRRPQDELSFVTRYEARSKAGTAIKWLKFHTSYVFAYAVGQSELPVAPGPFEEGEKPGRLVGGGVGRALAAVMARGRSGNWPARRCAYDILMSKLGFPPAPESFVEAAMKDHKAALSKTQEEPDEQTTCDLLKVEAKLVEIIHILFRGHVFSHRDLLPSLRSCLGNGLKTGGALAELYGDWQDSLDMDNHVLDPYLRARVLFGMSYTPEQGVSEIHFIDSVDEVSQFQDFVDDVWMGRRDERLGAQPCPILEPLKVRTITKGESAEYFRALELQKFMHGILRRHPVFEFIGHPIDDAGFSRAFGTKEDLESDEFYVSGDYKAATDNLNPRLSRAAWRAICLETDIWFEGRYQRLYWTPYYELGLKALTGHRLYYKKKYTKKDLFKCKTLEEEMALTCEVVDQSWGQLMGSPMSFPVLCLVNAAATLSSQELSFRKDTCVRINGDDVGFISTASKYAEWKRVTKACGLEFSMGKNYTSRDFMILNSELRRAPEGGTDSDPVFAGFEDSGTSTGIVPVYEYVERPKTWKLEGFLNQSLMYHTIKKGMDSGEQQDVYWTDLADRADSLLRGIPPANQWSFLKTFLNAHKDVLTEMPPLANLWFPRCLGGAGLPVPSGKTLEELVQERDPDLLEKQCKLAAYMACFPQKRLKVPKLARENRGGYDEIFKSISSMSDSQVRPVLRTKTALMYPGQRVSPSGSTYVGYVFRGLYDFFSGNQGDVAALQDPLLGGKHLGPEHETFSPASHRKQNAYLAQKYKNWTKGALETSLHPMKLSSLAEYFDSFEYASFVEILQEKPTLRSIDLEDQTLFYAAADVLSFDDIRQVGTSTNLDFLFYSI